MPTVTSIDGTNIDYSVVGLAPFDAKPPLVLVDGPLCFRQHGVTAVVAAELSKHFALYTFDRRGRGRSSDESNNSLNSISREMQDLHAVVAVASEQCRGQPPIICGFSTGATLGLLATSDGLSIAGLALFEPPFTVLGPDDKRMPTDATMQLHKLLSANDRSGAVQYFLTSVLGISGFVVSMMKLGMRDTWRNSISVAHTLPYDLALLANGTFPRAQLAGLCIPTLVVHCEQSPLVLQRAAAATVAAITGDHATLAVLPGKSHQLRGIDLAKTLLKWAS
jgi:pimeloyl-ACP methyl ester carboxylesterase